MFRKVLSAAACAALLSGCACVTGSSKPNRLDCAVQTLVVGAVVTAPIWMPFVLTREIVESANRPAPQPPARPPESPVPSPSPTASPLPAVPPRAPHPERPDSRGAGQQAATAPSPAP